MLETHTVIDVRTPAEFAAGHIAAALNIPVEASDFGARISQLDPEEAYLVYCRTGRRSAIAAASGTLSALLPYRRDQQPRGHHHPAHPSRGRTRPS